MASFTLVVVETLAFYVAGAGHRLATVVVRLAEGLSCAVGLRVFLSADPVCFDVQVLRSHLVLRCPRDHLLPHVAFRLANWSLRLDLSVTLERHSEV